MNRFNRGIKSAIQSSSTAISKLVKRESDLVFPLPNLSSKLQTLTQVKALSIVKELGQLNVASVIRVKIFIKPNVITLLASLVGRLGCKKHWNVLRADSEQERIKYSL